MGTGNGLYINIKNKNHTFLNVCLAIVVVQTLKLTADTTETLANYSVRESATISHLRHEEIAV